MNTTKQPLEAIQRNLYTLAGTLLSTALFGTLSLIFREDIYRLFETKEAHKPILIGILGLIVIVTAFGITLLSSHLKLKPYRMNLFRRFGILWNKKCQPHCKYCFFLMENMPENQHVISSKRCNREMNIVSDKGDRSTLEQCFDKFRKGK